MAAAKAKLGVTARGLTDEDLRRELQQLWRTREETIFRGSANAIARHTSRMLELEYELIARFPRETQPAPGRTRKGSRARSGQTPGRRGARKRN
jgi:hypothetical protein